MKPWKKRLIIILIFITSISLGVGIILKTFNDNIIFFYSPTDLITRFIKPSDKVIRVGGIVKESSIKKIAPTTIKFIITDNENELTIIYSGILPSLFKEKQATIALGKLKSNNSFIAQELLAKHNENYIPKELKNFKKTAK